VNQLLGLPPGSAGNHLLAVQPQITGSSAAVRLEGTLLVFRESKSMNKNSQINSLEMDFP